MRDDEAERFPEVRYLDASGSGLTTAELGHNVMLIHLSLAGCGLRRLHTTLPNLRSLDISQNKLGVISANDLSAVPAQTSQCNNFCLVRLNLIRFCFIVSYYIHRVVYSICSDSKF